MVSRTLTNQSKSDQETIILHDWPARDRPQAWQQLGSAGKYILSDRRASVQHCPSRVLLQSSVCHKGKGIPARLQAYKDIRLGLDEKRSIHEGSLVICVDPAYTLSDHDKPCSDEFDLVSGNILVVCRLYSDLWALCAGASPPQSEKVFGETITTEPMRLAFLPLCAVTLAANFSAFNQRCITYARDKSEEPRYPGNGLPVMPPPRTSSLSDGKQISRGNRRHIAFPEVVYDAFDRISECSDVDFVPADSSLENVLSDLTDRGSRRLQRLGNHTPYPQLCHRSDRSRAILYNAFALTTLPIRILGTLIYYLPHFTRPHPAWTYRQAISVKFFYIWLSDQTAVEYRTPKTLTPGREGDRFIIINPPDTTTSNQLALYLSRDSILTSIPSVHPVPIGAVWHPALPSSKPARVILHFHGGAYVLGGVRLKDNSWSPSILSKVMGCPVMLPQYRLSVERNASFPAALQDGITAYVYVLEVLGIEPQNIVLSGDSAGGNLVLSMIRYWVEEKKKGTEVLPLPAAALLWSPWLDLSENGAQKVDRHPCRWVDYLSGDLLDWGIRRVTPEGWERGHRFLNPLGNGFKALGMPIFVHTGTSEVFFEDHVEFVEEMRALGNVVEFCETKDAPHDIFWAGKVLGFEREAEEAMERARTFVRRDCWVD
ncbi:hypothetical protein AnigIFM59636_003210 [Aspergillus niger]|nr:hypothetical protein AnigIFM59636_003210 [Aspergillus niger]SPB50222.1 unnamed protein product [Aspergillus niger]